jgi:hypothetical protein
MENYLDYKRPSESIRDKLDITYKIEDQSVVIYEVRPDWSDNSQKIESGIAKATYIKSSQLWKVFWKRASGKWENYKIQPTVDSLHEFLELIDSHHCFWG